MYVFILILYSDKCGNAALIITPPSECPRKLIRNGLLFIQSNIYYLTSCAKLAPISDILPSVKSSLALLIK